MADEPNWQDVGVAGEVVLGFDGIDMSQAWWVSEGKVIQPIPARQGIETTFTVFDETHDILFKKPEPVEQAMSFRVDYEEPDLPPLMGKHPGCTGKFYRAYRRHHRRLRQQWKKAGSPTRSMSFYMPRVEVLFDELTQTMTATAVAAEHASQEIRKFGESWAMHPSNWKFDG